MKIVCLSALLLITPAWAQFGSAGAPPTMPGWSHAPTNAGGAVHPFRMPRNSREFAIGEAWLDTYTPQSGQPTYIVVQTPAPAATAVEPPRPMTPLMIERQGDRFVRTSSLELSHGPVTASPSVDDREAKQAKPRPATPLVTLIYRDGHREQIRDYSIVGDRLYASTDYAQSGSWMKTIQLSALDLPATVEANRDSGAHFTLPSASNVVVTNF